MAEFLTYGGSTARRLERAESIFGMGSYNAELLRGVPMRDDVKICMYD